MNSLEKQDAGQPRHRSELQLRVLSGLALAALALATVWAGGWFFGLFVALLAAVASWEWCRIVRGIEFDWLLVLHSTAVVLAALAASAGYGVPAAVGLTVVAIVFWVLRLRNRDAMSGTGVLAIGLPVVCLALMRVETVLGLQSILFIFFVVWATDIGGYMFGRSIGGPRLWTSISPSKTWAGAAGGLLLAALVGPIASALLSSGDAVALTVTAIMLGLAAEMGDLAESALKRRFGRKDASGLIPGHGGILDRVDGLMAAAVVATLYAMFRNPMHPAAGLLLWP